VFLASININSLLAALAPSGSNFIWGILLYIVLIMDVLTMLLQRESNLMLTIFLAISILSAFLNELGLNANSSNLDIGSGFFKQVMTTDGSSFANWMIGVIMVILPLVVVGMTSSPKSRFPGILAVIAAALYVFGRWVFSQILRGQL
jgi:hypothetical protein